MEENKFKYKIITLPNVLSMLRIALIPVFVWLYSFEDKLIPALIVLLVSGGTDIVDGFVARRYGMVSNVGRILDPAADKLTQLAVLACLCFKYPRLLILLAFLVVKELANGIIGLVMMHKNRDALDSKWHGKLTTVVIYFTCLLHLLWSAVPMWLSWVLISVCIALMVASFILYTVRNIKIIKGEEQD